VVNDEVHEPTGSVPDVPSGGRPDGAPEPPPDTSGAPDGAPGGAEPPAAKKSRHPFRRIASALLIFIGSVLAPLSVLSVWAKATITSTDRYVATVTPLASDPRMQAAITDRITSEIDARIQVPAAVKNALPQRAQSLVGPIENAVEGYVHTLVAKVVASPAFEKIWVEANRVAHQQLVNLLEGGNKGGVTVKNGHVTVDLHQVVAAVKEQLLAHGFTAASHIPTGAVPSSTITLFSSKGLEKAQTGFNALNTMGLWLPFIALAFLAAGVLLARRRRAALVRCAIYVAVGMVILLIVLAVLRHVYLADIGSKVQSQPAAAAAFDIMVRFLRQSTKAVLTLSVLVALAVWVTGATRRATAIRTATGRLLGRAGSALESAGVLPAGLRDWFLRFRWVLEVAVIVLFFLAVILWSFPTGLVIFLLALAALGLLGVIGIIRSRTPAELADLIERREAAAGQAPAAGSTPEGEEAEGAPSEPMSVGGGAR
jgi:hypothetical protein